MESRFDSIKRQNVQTAPPEEDSFQEQFLNEEDRMKQTFDSNLLNFSDDVDDVDNQELLSPMFTNGFDNFKKAFVSFDMSNAERKEFIDDFKSRLNNNSPIKKNQKFGDIVNESIRHFRNKKYSTSNLRTPLPEYNDLKFTHRNIIQPNSSENFGASGQRWSLGSQNNEDEISYYANTLQCYQFDDNHGKAFENSIDYGLIRELDRKDGEITEEDFCLTSGGTIKLPGKHLKFKYLHIPHSCKIVGSPETVLEISGAIFIGSFKNNSTGWETITTENEEQIAVHFCEVKIIFNPQSSYFRSETNDLTEIETARGIPKEEQKGSTTPSAYTAQNFFEFDSLFIIDSLNQTFLEIRDCIINPVCEQKEDSVFESDLKRRYLCSSIDQIYTLEAINYIKEKTDQPDLEFKSEDDLCAIPNIGKLMSVNCKCPPSIRMHSCVIRQKEGDLDMLEPCPLYSLFKVIQSSKIQLDSCCIEETLGSCLRLRNPQILDVFDSTITEAQESAISVEISKLEVSENYCRSLNIYNCEIMKNKGSGIEVYADEFVDQNLKIFVTECRISNNSQCGLFLARMAVDLVKITDSKFISNSGKGCYFKIVHQRFNKSCFSVKNSKFINNKENGLQIDDSGFELEKVNSNNNSKNGISINGTMKPVVIPQESMEFLKKHGMNTTMTNVTVNGNSGFGISIKSYWKGAILIAKSSCSKNSEDGLFLYTPIEKHPRTSIGDLERKSKFYDGPKNKISPGDLTNDKTIQQQERCPKERESKEISKVGRLVITMCTFMKNMKHGLNIMNTECTLNPSIFKDNKKYAIYMEREEDKQKLLIPPLTHGEMVIRGKAGGEWGKISIKKTSGCCIIQ
ncbi:unnamed protein product [Moneuplotes crassus]|uniref:Right handed beta helix domain-containing protein n=1 Tax=Euplotes crassus TaxID=5936 RepID=A0AAD1Y551_EUPCR|nr:unnamed protein product [Moneuplotes crassus]